MSKIFNITGNCHATKHYMADISKKLARTFTMVERGDYFIINRPRQYGKTTMLYTVAGYLCLCMAFSPTTKIKNTAFSR